MQTKRGTSVNHSDVTLSPLASAAASDKIRARKRSSVPSRQDPHASTVQLYLRFWCPLCPRPSESSLDGGTPSRFLQQKEFLREWPADLRCLAFSFTYKTPWPICLCTGCRQKVCVPSLEHEDPRCGVLHRTRLASDSKHGCSLQASEKNRQQLKEGLVK